MTVQAINHIDVSPGYLGGAPRIAGTRIAVHHLVVLIEHLNTSVEEVAEQYSLTLGQVYAALSYYHDHQAGIDQLIQKEDELLEQARTRPASPQEARVRAAWRERQSRQADSFGEKTVKEIAQEYGVDESTVREAAKRGWVAARKSGATWLIRSREAEARWGER